MPCSTRRSPLWRGPPLAEPHLRRARPGARSAGWTSYGLAAREERIAAERRRGKGRGVHRSARDARSGAPPARGAAPAADARPLPRRTPGGGADAVFKATRTALVDELGIEPGPALRELHAAILRHEVAVTPSSTGATDVGDEILRALAGGRLVPVLGLDDAGDLAGSSGARVRTRRRAPAGSVPRVAAGRDPQRHGASSRTSSTRASARLHNRAPSIASSRRCHRGCASEGCRVS